MKMPALRFLSSLLIFSISPCLADPAAVTNPPNFTVPAGVLPVEEEP
jgi:hypothetical protein